MKCCFFKRGFILVIGFLTCVLVCAASSSGSSHQGGGLAEDFDRDVRDNLRVDDLSRLRAGLGYDRFREYIEVIVRNTPVENRAVAEYELIRNLERALEEVELRRLIEDLNLDAMRLIRLVRNKVIVCSFLLFRNHCSDC